MDETSLRHKAMSTIEQHCNSLPLIVLERLASLVASIGRRVDETSTVEIVTVGEADTEPPMESIPPTAPSGR